MAGAGAADYSGAHSKRTLNTTQEWMPSGGQVDTAVTGSRHGKKTRSTPPGYRTTNTVGNGSLRHGDFVRVSEVATALSDIRDYPRSPAVMTVASRADVGNSPSNFPEANRLQRLGVALSCRFSHKRKDERYRPRWSLVYPGRLIL